MEKKGENKLFNKIVEAYPRYPFYQLLMLEGILYQYPTDFHWKPSEILMRGISGNLEVYIESTDTQSFSDYLNTQTNKLEQIDYLTEYYNSIAFELVKRCENEIVFCNLKEFSNSDINIKLTFLCEMYEKLMSTYLIPDYYNIALTNLLNEACQKNNIDPVEALELEKRKLQSLNTYFDGYSQENLEKGYHTNKSLNTYFDGYSQERKIWLTMINAKGNINDVYKNNFTNIIDLSNWIRFNNTKLDVLIDKYIDSFYWKYVNQEESELSRLFIIQELLESQITGTNSFGIGGNENSSLVEMQVSSENKFPVTIVDLSALGARVFNFNDGRKYYSKRLNSMFSILLSEVGRRFDLGYAEVAHHSWRELSDILLDKTKFELDKISNRLSHWAANYSNGNIEFLCGNEATNLVNNSLNNINTDDYSQLITGLGVSGGIVEGRVKVIKTYGGLNDIEKGDILVTTMTDPEWITVFDKCAGIITDEGGYLCHAAIVSREMRIPCIVGTKKSTQILTNGDRIIMNGENGTIKIIRRKSYEN